MEKTREILVSVIMPTFNRGNLIIETLNSVFNQQYRPIELIIIDDGSTDNTIQVIDEWISAASNDKKFETKVFSQKNSGPSKARNFGITQAKGELSQFLDSDDLIDKTRFNKIINLYKNDKDIDFFQTGFNSFVGNKNNIISTHLGHTNQNLFELALLGKLWANTLRACLHISLIRKITPWDNSLICFEDREYMEKAIANSKKSITIKEVLASARRDSGLRVSDNIKSYEGRKCRIICEENLFAQIEKSHQIKNEVLNIFSNRILTLGLRSASNGWFDLGERCYLLAVKSNKAPNLKFNLKKWMLFNFKKHPKTFKFIITSIFRLAR